MSRKCTYFNCGVSKDVLLYHVVFDLCFHLCPGHAKLLMTSKLSEASLIEFLVDAYGGKDKDYRRMMRNFIMTETRKIVNKQDGFG